MKKDIAAQMPAVGKPPEMIFSRATHNTLLMCLSGNWRIDQPMPSIAELEKQLKSDPQMRKYPGPEGPALGLLPPRGGTNRKLRNSIDFLWQSLSALTWSRGPGFLC